MAAEFQFPYPCEHFPTQHEAASLIEQYKAKGHIKRCAHLYVQAVGGGYGGARQYRPGCRKDSFQVERNPNSLYGNRLSHGCPPDCLLYRPWWRGREGWLKAKWWDLRGGIVGIAKWYTSLNGVVQVLIVLIILVVVSPPFLNALAEILRIIYGK